MGDWDIAFGAREIEPESGGGVTVGWVFELERDGVRRSITVEVARAVAAIADKSLAPNDVRRALTTRGSSAVMTVLDRDVPPRRLVVETDGIREVD